MKNILDYDWTALQAPMVLMHKRLGRVTVSASRRDGGTPSPADDGSAATAPRTVWLAAKYGTRRYYAVMPADCVA